MKYCRNIFLFVLLGASLIVSGCSSVGIATGAGAAVGISAAREGGLKGTANDIRISASISDKWFKYNVETFSKLSLTVEQGRVLVTGVVQDPQDRVEAIKLAWQVEGVRQVINEIRIADSQGIKGYLKDSWITAQLRTKITLDRDIQSVNYSIDTVQQIVYLMGIAQNQSELNKVIDIARTIPGVSQVISYVKIAGPEDKG